MRDVEPKAHCYCSQREARESNHYQRDDQCNRVSRLVRCAEKAYTLELSENLQNVSIFEEKTLLFTPMQVALAFDQTPVVALFAMHVTFNEPDPLLEQPLAHVRVAELFSERENFDGAFELEVFSFGFALQKFSITANFDHCSVV